MKTKSRYDESVIGKRVTLVSTSDQWTRLKNGSQGTVTGIRKSTDPDLSDVLNVSWDSGSCLSLLVGVDDFRIHDVSDDFLNSMQDYLTAGHKLLDAWYKLDEARNEFSEVLNAQQFPFAMSFDEYLSCMWEVWDSLSSANSAIKNNDGGGKQ